MNDTLLYKKNSVNQQTHVSLLNNTAPNILPHHLSNSTIGLKLNVLKTKSMWSCGNGV